MNTLEGKLVANDMKIGIVAARFNEFIVSKLLGGAVDGLVRHGMSEDNITAVWVPGAFEIPTIAAKLAKSGNKDAKAEDELVRRIKASLEEAKPARSMGLSED